MIVLIIYVMPRRNPSYRYLELRRNDEGEENEANGRFSVAC